MIVGRMTFDEAIAAPGRKFQSWGAGVKDGKRAAMIYSLGGTGAKQLAWKHIPEEERAALEADLTARGIAMVGYDFFCMFIWVTTPNGVQVYDDKKLMFDAAGDRATLEDGRVIERSDIATVIAFAHDDYVYRGVKAALRSGKEVPLVTEASGSAMGDLSTSATNCCRRRDGPTRSAARSPRGPVRPSRTSSKLGVCAATRTCRARSSARAPTRPTGTHAA